MQRSFQRWKVPKMESYELDTGLFKLLTHIKDIKALRMKLTDL